MIIKRISEQKGNVLELKKPELKKPIKTDSHQVLEHFNWLRL